MMSEIMIIKDNQKELKLQRELAYRRSLEKDEWVNDFISSIENFIDSMPFELSKTHVSDNAAFLRMKELKEWEDTNANPIRRHHLYYLSYFLIR